jgi:hypothetical protein
MELDEDSGGSDTMTFPGEDAAMMVYNAPLPQGGVVCLALVLGPRLAIVGDPGTHGYINIYYNYYKREKYDRHDRQGTTGTTAGQRDQRRKHAPLADAPG